MIALPLVCCVLLAACAQPRTNASVPAAAVTPDSAIAACKSALALKQSVNPVMVLPMSSAAIPGGREVFLSLNGKQWLCATDAYGNVGRLEARGG
ncbi:hypothetical protein [Achromobacter sp. AGC25]